MLLIKKKKVGMWIKIKVFFLAFTTVKTENKR